MLLNNQINACMNPPATEFHPRKSTGSRLGSASMRRTRAFFPLAPSMTPSLPDVGLRDCGKSPGTTFRKAGIAPERARNATPILCVFCVFRGPK